MPQYLYHLYRLGLTPSVPIYSLILSVSTHHLLLLNNLIFHIHHSLNIANIYIYYFGLFLIQLASPFTFLHSKNPFISLLFWQENNSPITKNILNRVDAISFLFGPSYYFFVPLNSIVFTQATLQSFDGDPIKFLKIFYAFAYSWLGLFLFPLLVLRRYSKSSHQASSDVVHFVSASQKPLADSSTVLPYLLKITSSAFEL